MMVLVETGEVGANYETVTGEGTDAQQKNSAATTAMLTRGAAITKTNAQSGNSSEITTNPNIPAPSRKRTKSC